MVTPAALRRWALSLEGVIEVDHMGRAAFRTTARIFATMHERRTAAQGGPSCNLKFTPLLQAKYVAEHAGVFEALAGGWGRMGWTGVELRAASALVLKAAIVDAYEDARPRAKAARPKPTSKSARKR